MVRTGRAAVLGGGCLAAMAVGYVLGGSSARPAQAQPPAVGQPAGGGRYQLSSFVLQKRETPGAYILDTRTGDVFQVVGRDPPVPIGSAAKPQPKK